MNSLNLSKRSLHKLNTSSIFDKSRVLSFKTDDLLEKRLCEFNAVLLNRHRHISKLTKKCC